MSLWGSFPLKQPQQYSPQLLEKLENEFCHEYPWHPITHHTLGHKGIILGISKKVSQLCGKTVECFSGSHNSIW